MPSILTTLAHASAPFIATFVLIHLTAPAMASVGGTSLASQVMILGREYYQTRFSHRYLVALPIIIHTLSGTAKRLIGDSRSRKLRSALSLTGYAAFLFFVPVHYLVHRVFPTDPRPPILSVGPAELDYEFVKVGLQQWPLINWSLYTGLTLCVVWHAWEGTRLLWNTWLAAKAGIWTADIKRRTVVVAATVLPVFMGLFAMSREPLMAFSFTAERYEACFRRLALFR